MRRWRSRLAIALVAVTVAAVAAWVASQMVPTARIAWSDDGDRGVTVSAELGQATCRKELTATFPWVRISCEPEADPDGGERVPTALDTAQDGE